ncbi:hypothetical protein, partial [Frankia nepalensis]|uniref:hypothetical protein n=1 Tax=Frankia nepalensis TaxID=1836974 RepID=UPI001EE4E227
MLRQAFGLPVGLDGASRGVLTRRDFLCGRGILGGRSGPGGGLRARRGATRLLGGGFGVGLSRRRQSGRRVQAGRLVRTDDGLWVRRLARTGRLAPPRP